MLEKLNKIFNKKQITGSDLIDILTAARNLNSQNSEKFRKYEFYLDKGKIHNIFDLFAVTKFDFSCLTDAGKIVPGKLSTSAEFLMFALMWKNGDLGKEKSIAFGLRQQKNVGSELDAYGYPATYSAASFKESAEEKKRSVPPSVFYQYGLFLNTLLKQRKNRNFLEVEPIIDQHSIRAYICLYKKDKTPKVVSGSKIQKYAKEYKEWHRGVIEKCPDSLNAFLVINEVMFLVGKHLKQS